MPALNQDKEALDWAATNADDPRAGKVLEKLGLGGEDLKAWQFSLANPNDERSVLARNKVFEKVANSQPATENVFERDSDTVKARLAIKNLIPNEPELQKAYLEKKGFQVRMVPEYEAEGLPYPNMQTASKSKATGKFAIELKKPDETRWRVLDPKGIDLWDVTDVLSDAVEAAAVGIATGAKALGALGAPVTGLASIPATSAIGAAATGSFEAGRQTLAKALGARDEYNPSQIAQSAMLGGAIPAGFGVGGKLVEGAGFAGKKLLSGLGVALKPNAEEIKVAAKTIGAEATPGQLFNSPLVQKLESAQVQSSGKLGGTFLRKQVAENQKAVQATADALVKDAAAISPFEVGQQVEKQMLDSVKAKLAPAEEIYTKYESIFSRNAYKPDMSSVTKKIAELKDEFRLDDKALSLIKRIEDKIPELNNLDDLKKFRTLVSDMYDPMDKATKRVVASLNGPITEVRSNTLINLAKDSPESGFFQTAKAEIEKADKIYKQTAEEVRSAFLAPGKSLKQSPKATAESFFQKTPEIDRINKILKTNDPEKIKAVKEAFPEAFESLRQGKIQELASKAEVSGEVNPRKLAKLIDGIPPETRKLIFDENAELKAKALKVYLDNIPPRLGPSGTPEGLQIFQTLNVWNQINSLSRSALSSLLTSPESIMKLGRGLQTGWVKGAGAFGTRQGLPLPDEQRLRIPQGLTIPAKGN